MNFNQLAQYAGLVNPKMLVPSSLLSRLEVDFGGSHERKTDKTKQTKFEEEVIGWIDSEVRQLQAKPLGNQEEENGDTEKTQENLPMQKSVNGSEASHPLADAIVSSGIITSEIEVVFFYISPPTYNRDCSLNTE